MFHRQLGEPLTVGEEHRARNDVERSGTIPGQSGEGRLERGGASHGDGFYGETYLTADELRSKLGKPVVVALRPTCLKAKAWPFHVPELPQLLAECVPPEQAAGIGGAVVEQTDPVHFPRLLRLGGERHGEDTESEDDCERSA